jgi:hypothetical protein
VLDGLEGASASSGKGFDRARIDATLSALEARVFLLHDVHESAPVLFQSRWALSYLRGPLSRVEIQRLAKPGEPVPPRAVETVRAASDRPLLAPEIEQVFLAPSSSSYAPFLCGEARVHFTDAKLGLDHWEKLALLAPLASEPLEVWEGAEALDGAPGEAPPPEGARFAPLPQRAAQKKSYEAWAKDLASYLARTRTLALYRSSEPRLVSRPGESEGEFRGRLAHGARESRDGAVATLEKRWSTKLASARERLRRAEERVGREQAQLGQQKMQTAISVGATVLGALFGRKTFGSSTVGRATTAARGFGRTTREQEEVDTARRELSERQAEVETIERQLAEETAALRATVEPQSLPLERLELRPKRAGVEVVRVRLAWRG